MPSARYLKYREKILAYARDNRERVNAIKQRYAERHPDRVKASRKKYADAHMEEHRQKSLAYYYEHKEAYRERARAWRQNNPEKAKARDKRYHERHPEKAACFQRNWRAKNPTRVLILNAAYRANKVHAPINDLTEQDWEDIKAQYGYRCVYCPADCRQCRQRTHKLTQEHLTPLSQGGPHTKANVVPACGSCNSRKKDRAILTPVQPMLI